MNTIEQWVASPVHYDTATFNWDWCGRNPREAYLYFHKLPIKYFTREKIMLRAEGNHWVRMNG